MYDGLDRTKRYNLTSRQRVTLKELKERKDLIIGLTDKNLGPFVVERKTYIQQCLNEHLLKTDYYQQLTEDEKNDELSS